jgi:hypothetical protein
LERQFRQEIKKNSVRMHTIEG